MRNALKIACAASLAIAGPTPAVDHDFSTLTDSSRRQVKRGQSVRQVPPRHELALVETPKKSGCDSLLGYARTNCLNKLGGKTLFCGMKNSYGRTDGYTLRINPTTFLPEIAKTQGLWHYDYKEILGPFEHQGVISIRPLASSATGWVTSISKDPRKKHIKMGTLSYAYEFETEIQTGGAWDPHHIILTVRKTAGSNRYYWGYGPWIISIAEVIQRPDGMPTIRLYHSLRWGYSAHPRRADNSPHRNAAWSDWYAIRGQADKTCTG